MALDKVLKIYDENGNPVDYDILASDVKFLPDGKDLPTKLTEMEDAIEDAAQTGGDGTVTGVKVGSTPYNPDSNGVVDLSVPFADKADKTQLQTAITSLQNTLNTLIGSGNVQGAIDTFNEVVAFLNGIDTSDPTLFNQLKSLSDAITALQTALAGKISGIKANGASTTLPVDQNGIVELPPTGSTISPAMAAPQMDGNTASVGSSAKYAREDHVHPHDTSKLSKSDVSVETQGDGTVDINVKDDTYTINLNHTHEGMAKLVVCEESDLPSTLDMDTIYAQVDDASNPTEIETLYIAGLEFAGGGVPAGTPAITKPSGSSITLGENDGSGVSSQVLIKANAHITGDLTVTLAANSDLSFDTTNLPTGVTYNNGAGTLTIAQVNAIAGVQIPIVYSGSGAAEIDGGIVISGGGASPKSVVVVVKAWEEIDLDAANREIVNGWPGSAGVWSADAGQYSILIPTTGYTQVEITANENKAPFFLFCKTRPASSPGPVDYASLLCNGESGRRTQTKDTTEVYTLPSDCVCVVIGLSSGNSNEIWKPTSVRLK